MGDQKSNKILNLSFKSFRYLYISRTAVIFLTEIIMCKCIPVIYASANNLRYSNCGLALISPFQTLYFSELDFLSSLKESIACRGLNFSIISYSKNLNASCKNVKRFLLYSPVSLY